jgi:hypothetical protein
VDCNDHFEDLFFSIGGKWIELSAVHYVYKESSTSSVCYLTLLPTIDDEWHFGANLLQGYYTHFSAENKIGFIPYVESSKRQISDSTTPKYDYQTIKWETDWIYDWYSMVINDYVDLWWAFNWFAWLMDKLFKK